MPIDGGGASQHLFRSSAMSHFRPPTISQRSKCAATKLMRKLLKKYGFVSTTIVTDHFVARSAAMVTFGFQ
jgi:hypothetical protein